MVVSHSHGSAIYGDESKLAAVVDKGLDFGPDDDGRAGRGYRANVLAQRRARREPLPKTCHVKTRDRRPSVLEASATSPPSRSGHRAASQISSAGWQSKASPGAWPKGDVTPRPLDAQRSIPLKSIPPSPVLPYLL